MPGGGNEPNTGLKSLGDTVGFEVKIQGDKKIQTAWKQHQLPK